MNMSQYEADYPDHTKTPGYSHGDEPPCNTSANPTLYDVIDARSSRRGILVGGLAAAVGGAFGAGVARTAQAQARPLLGFKAIPVSEADSVVVPEGYKVQVLAPWGTPISGSMPAFRGGANTGAEQGMQIGMHHDGIHFFPINGSSTDGLLAMNHEYVEARFLHAAWRGREMRESSVRIENDRRDSDEVLKEINAHGVSVVRVQRGADGNWAVMADPRNRRITAATPMNFSGPVRGSKHVVTKYSPDGTRTRGTINNCAHGVTPWNTYMTAEENWAGYFRNTDRQDQKPNQPREHSRYGVATERSRYAWELAASGADEFVRFDASTRGANPAEDYRNEPNGFGWMVEIDPFDPNSVPVKRTHLGRFAH
jgi:secreted PhoX family phosphatase